MRALIKVGLKVLVVAFGLTLFSCEYHEDVGELRSESGGRLRVELRAAYDDPSAAVIVTCLNERGRRLGNSKLIGIASLGPSGRPDLRHTNLQLYEAKGGELVGLYRDVEPGVILVVADFGAGWALGLKSMELDSDVARSSKAVELLSEVAGRKLELAEYLVNDWN